MEGCWLQILRLQESLSKYEHTQDGNTPQVTGNTQLGCTRSFQLQVLLPSSGRHVFFSNNFCQSLHPLLRMVFMIPKSFYYLQLFFFIGFSQPFQIAICILLIKWLDQVDLVHLLAAREQELRAIAAEVLNKSTLVLYFQKFAIGVWGWDVWNCGLSGGYVSHWYPWISDGHQIHRVHLLVSFLQLKINSPLLIYKALSARGINCRQKFDLRGVLLVSGMLIFYEFVQSMTRWSHWSILFSSFFSYLGFVC